MRDAEALGGLPRGQIRDSQEPLVRHGAGFSAQATALCAHTREASPNALLNARPLKLRDRAEDPGDEPSGRCAGVDPLAERDERDPARMPVVEQHHQVPKVPPETIETPAHDRLHLMAPHIGDELVERRPAIFCTADAVVHVLDGAPAASRNIGAKFDQLILGRLIVRAHTGIHGDLHALLRRVAAVFGSRLLAFDALVTGTPCFFSHACNARSTWTESGTPSRSLTRRRPSMMSASTRKAVSSFRGMSCV
jgi:hypothetical protein